MESIEENTDVFRSQLLCFRNALANLGLENEELHVELEGFQWFMKQWIWFLWTDFDLRAQLVAGIKQIEEFEARLKPLIEHLENMLETTAKKQEALREECRMLIVGA